MSWGRRAVLVMAACSSSPSPSPPPPPEAGPITSCDAIPASLRTKWGWHELRELHRAAIVTCIHDAVSVEFRCGSDGDLEQALAARRDRARQILHKVSERETHIAGIGRDAVAVGNSIFVVHHRLPCLLELSFKRTASPSDADRLAMARDLEQAVR